MEEPRDDVKSWGCGERSAHALAYAHTLYTGGTRACRLYCGVCFHSRWSVCALWKRLFVPVFFCCLCCWFSISVQPGPDRVKGTWQVESSVGRFRRKSKILKTSPAKFEGILEFFLDKATNIGFSLVRNPNHPDFQNS